MRINSYAHVEDSILFEGVDIGRHARVRRAIIEKRCAFRQAPRSASIRSRTAPAASR